MDWLWIRRTDTLGSCCGRAPDGGARFGKFAGSNYDRTASAMSRHRSSVISNCNYNELHSYQPHAHARHSITTCTHMVSSIHEELQPINSNENNNKHFQTQRAPPIGELSSLRPSFTTSNETECEELSQIAAIPPHQPECLLKRVSMSSNDSGLSRDNSLDEQWVMKQWYSRSYLRLLGGGWHISREAVLRS